MREYHSSFSVMTTGLHVSPKYPHLGASPDGLTSCSCCGEGLLEVKCPYSIRHTTPSSARYMEATKLSRKHDYYYQVQGQLGILERSFCDFVSWTPKGMNIERIKYECLFEDMCTKLTWFFVIVILPKILTGVQEHTHISEETEIYCYCRKGEFGKMVKCDRQSCKHGWYHFSCVGLTTAPEGVWFCPDCK